MIHSKAWKSEVKRILQTIEKTHQDQNTKSVLDETTYWLIGACLNSIAVAQEDIEERGQLIIQENGKLVTNPSVSIMFRAMNIVLSLIKEEGLSPKARKYIKSEAKTETPLDKLLDFAAEI